MSILPGLTAGQLLAEEERKKREKEKEKPKGLSWGNPKRRLVMQYVLGEEPRTPSEAFGALENTFGGDEFSQDEAEEALKGILDLSPSEASVEFRRLLRNRVIEEA